MKSTATIKTLSALALVSSALFAGTASADRGFVQISFGNIDHGRHAAERVHAPKHEHHDHKQASRYEYRTHGDFHNASFNSIDARQNRQIARIAEGLRSGELTPSEAQKLLREQQQIAQMERRYLADGRLDPMEWRRIDKELDDAGHNIREEKHDGPSRW